MTDNTNIQVADASKPDQTLTMVGVKNEAGTYLVGVDSEGLACYRNDDGLGF